MLTFTDPRLYVFGIGIGYMTALADGSVKFWSDKFQDGNLTVAGSDNVLNAGIGNAPAIIIPTDPNVQVQVTAGDYNEYAKAAAVGASISYGAPVMTCQTVTASGTSISIGTDAGTPVAGPGMEDAVCYVQEIGAASDVVLGGVAYPVDASTGAISGFVSESGKSYLVSYYVSQANASMTTITTDIKGEVVRFVLARPIYTNYNPNTNSGDLYGWLYEIVPRLQLTADGASNSGGQTAYTTTGITGRAIAYDAETISAGCDDCAFAGAPLMYRIIVPCDETSGVEGILGALGGEVTVASGSTVALDPAVIVNGKLSYSVPVSEFAFTSSATSVATVGEHTGVVTGASTGSADITVAYSVGSTTFTDHVAVEVTA